MICGKPFNKKQKHCQCWIDGVHACCWCGKHNLEVCECKLCKNKDLIYDG